MRRRDEGRREKAAPAALTSGAALLKEAQQQQRRGERSKEALSERLHFSAAAERYRAALQQQLSEEDRADAAFGLGECLQRWAEAHVCCARVQALTPGLLAAEAAACREAASLLAQSLEAYAQVRGDAGAQREDALVNAGNVLCLWAELGASVLSPSEALALLGRACDAYDAAAAAAQPDLPADVELLCNWADALVKRAEGEGARGDADAAAALYQRALCTYEAACTGVDAAAGDDLAGLLYNWGCSLSSYASHMPGLECTGRVAALERAAEKLTRAAEFGAGDSAPCNALGDVLHAAAECASDAGAPPADVAVMLQRALDQGYLLALRLSRGDTDAQLGVAEVRLALARLAAAAGDGASALALASQAADSYGCALGRPATMGTVSERMEAQYNFACAAANCGRLDEARAALQQLVECGGTTQAEVDADADLAALR